MSPEDLVAVDRSWVELREERDELVEHLTGAFRRSGPPDLAAERAGWLVDAVDELVGLLRSPSKLEDRARRWSEWWPVPETRPSFVIEGRAWMRAARVLLPSWTEETETAWRHAWLLVSAVVEDEALSPFAIPAAPPRS